MAGMSDGALSIWSIDAAGLRRLDVAGPAMISASDVRRARSLPGCGKFPVATPMPQARPAASIGRMTKAARAPGCPRRMRRRS